MMRFRARKRADRSNAAAGKRFCWVTSTPLADIDAAAYRAFILSHRYRLRQPFTTSRFHGKYPPFGALSFLIQRFSILANIVSFYFAISFTAILE